MKWYILSILAVVGLSLTPYLLIKPDSQAADDKPGLVVSHGTYASKVRSIDPATCGDTMSALIQADIYEGLYTYDYLARPVKVVPQVAEAMPEISADGLTYTIRLRKGIKYHRNACFGLNGDKSPRTREMVAGDFVLAFKRIADVHIVTPMSLAFIEDKVTGIGEYRDSTRRYAKGDFARYNDLDIAGIKALDNYTLQIKLDVPFPQLIYVLAIHNYAPIPHEILDTYLSKTPMNERVPTINQSEAAVGTGPYYFTKWDPNGNDIELTRNPDFREAFYPQPPDQAGLSEKELLNLREDLAAGLYKDAGKRIPFIDVQKLWFRPEETPSWQMFLTNQTDASGIPAASYSQVISPGKELTDEWATKGIRLMKYASPAVYWLAFNMEDPVLGKSKSLRQALCLGFNVEAYIDVLFNGRGIRATTYIPSSFVDAFSTQHRPADGPYSHFDLVAAKTKIKQAKRELIAAGVMKEGDDLPTLTLDLGGREEDQRRFGEFVQKQFRKVGVVLKIEQNDWPTQQEKVENKQVQIYSMGWHADYPDPENFLQLYYTPNIKRGTNNCNYSNPAFDKLYEQAAKMLPSPQRDEIYCRMLDMLCEDCPTILLSEPVSFVLFHDWVYNSKPHPVGYGMIRYERIDAAQRAKELGGR